MNELQHPDPSEEEFVPEDDTIIATAMKWSLLVIVLIGAVIGLFFLLGDKEEATEEIKEKNLEAIEDLDQDIEEAPKVVFRDVTSESGIDFSHQSGARGEKLLPETMGGGVAFFDYDGDGDQDLLLVNGTVWPHDREGAPASNRMALYQNDGKGQFRDVAKEVGLDVACYGMGPAVGDYDNDGDPDLFVASVGENLLLRNDDGHFHDVGDELGVSGDPSIWGASAGFFDYDNDGDLDLMVCNYVQWSREIDIELAYTINGIDRAYGPPKNYGGSFLYLYRNDGERFVDVSQESGIQVKNRSTGVPVAKALALVFHDFDRDGSLDVIIANDTVRNFLLHNQGDGTFVEVGVESGVAYDSEGSATGAMGIDVAHYRNDDSLGIGIGNFANEMTSLYVSSREPMQFTDEAIGEGIGSPSRLRLSFGLVFFDYDLDGRQDMLQANGHLEETINQVQPSQHYQQPAQLFWNCGPDALSCFVPIKDEDMGDLGAPLVGRGCSYADIDGDGDLDVVITQTGDRPRLFRNEQDLGNHFVRLKLVGKSSNRDAIGARVVLKANGIEQTRVVSPTRSYLSQVELPVTFGLKDATEVDSLVVHWPDGKTQEVSDVSIDQLMVIEQG